MPSGISRAIRFGVFEVDLQEAELRKSGIRIKLQEQPFQILCILLEHPGQTVSREELRRRLWSADTFVDFDHSLNSSVKKLREALGDDSESPRFIETLHRRGYRFIAPMDRPGPSAPEQERQVLGVVPRHSAKQKFKTWPWLVTALTAVIAGLFLFWPSPHWSPPRIRASEQLTDDGVQKLSPVTDGKSVYYTELLANYRIAQVSATGGQPVELSIPIRNPVVTDLSADFSELLVAETTTELGPFNFALWAVPLPGGSPRRLGGASGGDAVWAPDGKLIFTKLNELYIAGHYGENPRRLATAPGHTTSPSISADGIRIRFTVQNPSALTVLNQRIFIGPSEIWEVRSDGTDLHPLLRGWNNPPAECCGRWTPDGKYYIFQSTRERTTNLWILPEDSRRWRKSKKEPLQLSIGPLPLSSPVVSKDGRKLFVIGFHQRAELMRYDTKSKEFVPYLGGISAGDVEFSRDGQWVAYVSYPDGTLWRCKADGSERFQLTYSPMFAALAHWSPDGKQIAFSGTTPGKPWKVFLVSSGGGSPAAVTADETQETDPTWSPDGKILAFGHNFDDPKQLFIELFDIDTHETRKLPGSDGIFAPRWSPDGRHIVALSPDNQKLLLYDVRSKQWRQVPCNLHDFGYLAWSRNSSYVYFDDTSSSGNGFYRVRISDARMERIVDFQNISRFPDQFWQSWTGLGPGDTPLFVRDISTQEIYALDLNFP